MLKTMRLIKIRRLLLAMFWLLCGITIQAQQEPNFTLYNFNLNIINPAYASVKKHAEVSLSYRSQWTGIPYAPNTSVLSFVSPIHKNMGFGLSVVNDEVFISNKTDASFDLAYQIRFTKDLYIHLGLKASASFIDLNLLRAGAPDRDMLFSKNESYVVPTVGAGIYVAHPKYYISLSTPNASKVNQYSLDEDTPDIVVNYLHIYCGAGYHADLSRTLSITPALMTRFIAGATPTFDLSTTLDYMDKIKAGFNYRWQESVSIYSLFSSKGNFKFGFSYDMNVSEIAQVNTHGSLELLLRYTWN